MEALAAGFPSYRTLMTTIKQSYFTVEIMIIGVLVIECVIHEYIMPALYRSMTNKNSCNIKIKVSFNMST
jgi:hypothetical protein